MFTDKKFLRLRDGVELYTEIKESGSPVWIVATHGIGEHLERHKYLTELFGNDFNVFQYDLRGHGRSTGKRSYVNNFSEYMEDLSEILKFLKDKYRMERFVLFGHSMGALITCSFMQNYVEDDLYPECVFVNAPPVGVDGALGKIMSALPLSAFKTLTNLPASVAVSGSVNMKYLSHDPRTREAYVADNLNMLKLETKLLLELAKTSKETFVRPLRIKCPAFVTVGSSDRIVGVKELLNYFTQVDKSFNVKVIEGAYHEIHNEIEKYRRPYFDHLKSVFYEILAKK